MKILYISGDSGVEVGGRKGASTHIRETCHALQRFGHEVRIVTPTPGDLSRVKVPVIKVPPFRAKWIGSDARHLLLNFRMGKAIEKEMRTFKPDAVYERYSLYQTAGLKLCHKYKLPRILEVNTLLAKEQAKRLHYPWLAEKVENSLWQREKAIICVSQKLKDLMTEAAGLKESAMAGFEISPVAVDTEVFNPNVVPDDELVQLKQGRALAGYVGTLTAWHGVDLFFDVAKILQERNVPILTLAVGGEPERVERLKARVKQEGLESHLQFYGSVDHHRVPGFLAAMDMCLIADTQDWSSPTKFFEFAAMGKAIVASRSPSVIEVFGGDGKAGMIFERGSAAGMADAMIEVANNPELAASLGAAARRRVLERYTWQCNIKTIMKLYRAMGAANAEFPPEQCLTPADGTELPRA